MQTVLERDALVKPLNYVAGVVERRQTMPILSYLLLRQEGEEITLTGTDLEVEVSARLSASKRSNCEMTLPARKLLDICRALPAGAVLEVKKEGDKAHIKAGKSRFTLLTQPTSDFPIIQIPQWDQTLRLQQKDLKFLFVQTQFCMAQQDVRYYLNGLLLEFTDKTLRAVATDGHRMAIAEIVHDQTTNTARQVIVPRKGVQEITRLLEDAAESVEIQISQNHLRVKTEGLVFTSKLIDGKYPDYTKVVPTAQSKTIRIGREEFRDALSRVAILSSDKFRGVRLTLTGNNLKITAHNPEQEEAQEEVASDYRGEGMEIGFNVNYMIEAISAFPSRDITLGLNDPNSSCTITSPDTKTPLYVIMPMRL